MNKIYVVGHKSPDLDSVVSAIAYASLKNRIESTDSYQPAVAGDMNRETVYLLEKFGFSTPERLSSISGEKVILVDHNEASQALDGFEEAQIIEVLDHHKINFSYGEAIIFQTLPWGASATIIADAFFNKELNPEKNLAALLLSAILVDTVITKSPTCTTKDKEVIGKLATLADIVNYEEFGTEIFKVRSSISDLSASDIVKSDFKEYDFKDGKFFLNQVETSDVDAFRKREDELLVAMKELKNKESYHSVITFITDILIGGSKFLVLTDDEEKMSRALGSDLSGEIYLPGIMSRKKQVVPMISNIFDK